ncbi:MAG TPA: hypothetical protein VKS22_06010 [Candidatus Binataceae bacterium]|nr:hypothetical protein [Candidatus Binataceae bacterium]
MKTGVGRLSYALVAGMMVAIFAVSSASAKTVKTVKGSGNGSFTFAVFSYDGLADADIVTYSGKDNVGGSYTGQTVAEWSPTTTTCTAPDTTAGVEYTLVQSNAVTTFAKGQVFLLATPSSSDTFCASLTTGSQGGALTYTVTAGSGKFAAATGTITITFTNAVLAAPGTPPGELGIFGAEQFTESGSVTY